MKDAKSEFTAEEGKILVKTARKTVERFLKNNSKLNDEEFNSKFNFNSGVFVTINKQENLRGCIGYPLPVKKLSESLIDAAIAAATQDPRFPAVDKNELDDLVFEVTVLTTPKEIIVNDAFEYLSKIKVGEDGLIVENNRGRSGLLLPQVPTEYGWNEEEFLGHTCEKAGLETYAWKDTDSTKISKFQGKIFKETSPRGDIIQG